jgi:hypothetical protein
MSIADCRRAFQDGLDGRASCLGAKLGYVQDGKRQRLSFPVSKPDGTVVEVGAVIPASTDPTAAARAMAEYFVATLNGTAGPSVFPIIVEKPGGEPSPQPMQVVQSSEPDSKVFDDTVASVGTELDAVKRALILIIKATNDGFADRTAEWQDELARRSAAIHTAGNLSELKVAFAHVEAFFRGDA